jgi:hypothetical protein
VIDVDVRTDRLFGRIACQSTAVVFLAMALNRSTPWISSMVSSHTNVQQIEHSDNVTLSISARRVKSADVMFLCLLLTNEQYVDYSMLIVFDR